MHYEEMLSWLLFYTSLLDVTKTPQVDITDPGGIVRSQVVENADGALRLILNASQSERTQSSRFLIGIFRLRRAAYRVRHRPTFSPPPRNSKPMAWRSCRFRKTTTMIWKRASIWRPICLKKLKARNILYDKDDTGEYLQVYTQSFKELFFFEIVERRRLQGLRRVQRADPAGGAIAAAAPSRHSARVGCRNYCGITTNPARGKCTTISPANSSRRLIAICCADDETISPLTATFP